MCILNIKLNQVDKIAFTVSTWFIILLLILFDDIDPVY